MVGRGGSGARPGMLRGGREARGGTGGDGRRCVKQCHKHTANMKQFKISREYLCCF